MDKVTTMIVAFTGHRPNKLGGYKLPNSIYNRVCKELTATLKDLKPTKAISGMALGVDQWAAMVCVNLHIPFIAAVPFPGQESVWPEPSQRIYKLLLKKADDIVIVNDAPFAAGKLQKRNEWMVDQCDKLIAVFDGTEGGTANCVKYAEKHNKEIIRIDPTNFRI